MSGWEKMGWGVKHSGNPSPLELQWGEGRRMRQLEVGAEISKGAWKVRTEVIGYACVSI